MIRRLLLDLARLPIFAHLIGWVFARASFLLPVRRLADTPTLVAFQHPRPAYPVHILIVPKKAIPSLAQLTPTDGPFLVDMLAAARALAPGCRLVANAGAYQSIPQLHFHLISQDDNPGTPIDNLRDNRDSP